VQLWICGPAGYASWDAPFTAHLTRTSKHTVGYIGQLVVVALCKASVLIAKNKAMVVICARREGRAAVTATVLHVWAALACPHGQCCR
jgi:hypothetical protein